MGTSVSPWRGTDRSGAHGGGHGRAVQVFPIKPKLKPPGTKRLKLKCDVLLSNYAFKFNLRCYTMAVLPPPSELHALDKVGRCRLTL